ncbi:DUF2642 domain-containing protein [Bacillus sp. 1P06AnD]|uniref:DUF2642 domain-containing protein n=1 Tax=Bacillus sp. 1P06AnD TaxID=3132208 RepID=UPI0039A2CA4B
MTLLDQYHGKEIEIEISGDNKHRGVLIDSGLDIMVLFNGTDFIYIPINHLKNFRLSVESEQEISFIPDIPIMNDRDISYRKTLTNAKGVFVEIFVAGRLSLHGYITGILTNYFVFYSPVYQTMYIPFFHLKWLIPYPFNQTPYSIDKKLLPVNPAEMPLARTFEEQIKKIVGKIIVIDSGATRNKIGLLKNVENNMIELITAEGDKLYCNIQHIKTVHYV